jgi:hypothetical protein
MLCAKGLTPNRKGDMLSTPQQHIYKEKNIAAFNLDRATPGPKRRES